MSEFLFLPFRQSGNIHRIASTHNPPQLDSATADERLSEFFREKWTVSPARRIYSSMH